MDNKQSLAYWIEERSNIYMEKEGGMEKPWSDDRIFQTVYFCNVRRENDKVTKWIRNCYTPEFFGKNYDLAIVASRLFNLPETLSDISNHILQFNPTELLATIHARQDAKKQVWGGAYVITTHGQKMPKSVYCVGVLEEAYRMLPLDGVSNCDIAYHVLMTLDGIGSFLAAQIVADLKNTDGHGLRNALDWHDFAAHGPGSLRGLGWFHERKFTPNTFMAGLLTCRAWLENSSAAYIVKHICNQDLQNCLCEYDKYMRVKNGTGRSKRRYSGT